MKTSKPSRPSRRRSVEARRRFWKTPPERQTVRKAGLGGRGGHELAGDLGDRLVERRGEHAGGPAGGDALEEGEQGGPRIVDEDPVDAGHARRQGDGPAVAGRDLEVDGGLRLVLGHVAEAEQRGGGIEEASRRGRERRVEPAGDLGPEHGNLARIEPRREGRHEVGVEGRLAGPVARAPGTLARTNGLGAEDVPERHPPGLLHGERPARQRRPPEPRKPSVPGQIRGEDLPAPQRPIVAHPEAVVGDADERIGEPVLRGARDDVGVVVLDRDAPLGGEVCDGVLRGEVLGVEVVGRDLGLEREQPTEMREAVREGPVRRQVLEVAVVGRDVGPSPAGQGERVLQLRADRQDRPLCCYGEGQGLGGVAAPATHERDPTRDHAADRIVVARADLAVVDEERVGEAGQALRGVGIVGCEGLVGEVAGREHDRAADGCHQEVVERRVGQEDPQPVIAGRDGRREARLPAAARHQQDDRPLRPGQEDPLGGPHEGEPLHGRDVGDHHCERLGPAPLPVAEPLHRGLVGGVAGEVIATQALDRDDPPCEEIDDGGGQGRVFVGDGRGRGGGPVGELRPAGRAGHRLGVEAPVRRVGVLRGAGRAERETRASSSWRGRRAARR